MKNLFLIGGAMGVGKTTVCKILNEKLPKSVFLDGDWCWNASPFTVTDETKKMVMDNVTHLLNNFIKCSAYENIIFCWVMHEKSIIDEILSKIDTSDCKVFKISLILSEKELEKRLELDIKQGLRHADVIKRSMERLHLYNALETIKIDASLSPSAVADEIIVLCNKE